MLLELGSANHNIWLVLTKVADEETIAWQMLRLQWFYYDRYMTSDESFHDDSLHKIPVAYVTKYVNPSLAKPPLKFSGNIW